MFPEKRMVYSDVGGLIIVYLRTKAAKPPYLPLGGKVPRRGG